MPMLLYIMLELRATCCTDAALLAQDARLLTLRAVRRRNLQSHICSHIGAEIDNPKHI
jgi:hypothetical protein